MKSGYYDMKLFHMVSYARFVCTEHRVSSEGLQQVLVSCNLVSGSPPGSHVPDLTFSCPRKHLCVIAVQPIGL